MNDTASGTITTGDQSPSLAAPKIKNVYVFGNGMVMTFDQYGKQMPEFQGRDCEVREKIRAAYDGPIVGLVWDDYRAAYSAAYPAADANSETGSPVPRSQSNGS